MNRSDVLIEANELMARLTEPKLHIFDASIFFYQKEGEPSAFEAYQDAHIAGAAFFEHKDFSDQASKYMYMVLPEAELAAQIAKVGISNDSEVVLYATNMLPCATRAWWVLRYAGLDNVKVLNGGLAAWQEAGGQVSSGVETYEAGSFVSKLRPDMFASKEDVEAAMQNGSVCTVHTLGESVYNKAHITGSSNLPFSNLMSGMAGFLSDDEMATEIAQEAKHERVITYCGGGIGATANAMAHLMVGNKNVAVYDGSMDEWAGENLPITSSETS